jgi:hypothetical protein
MEVLMIVWTVLTGSTFGGVSHSVTQSMMMVPREVCERTKSTAETIRVVERGIQKVTVLCIPK